MEDIIYDYDYNEYADDITSATALTRTTSYEIIKNDSLEKLREKLISECMDYTCCSKEEATILLIQYQWNIERIRDQWYDNVEANRQKYGLNLSKESTAQLKKMKVEPENEECYVCFSPKDSTFFALNCNHYFCGDCWVNYIESRLEDIHTCISASCPQQGCNLIIPESVFYKFVAPTRLKEFEKCIYKNFTDNNVDIKWCPTPDCGTCIRSITHYMKEITCECKNVFCFKCGKDGHRPCQCEMIEAWEIKNNSESENLKWLIANTKQCPSCHKYIEKNQGCNHMTCRKEAGGCGYEFCWICMGEWAPHGTSYYQCNRFDAEKVKDKEKTQKEAKFELERYVFHFDRYNNHNKAQQLSLKLRTLIQNEMKEINSEKGLPFDEMGFLEEAVETIIKARRCLKNTYVFGYYMIECKERQLFEHNQTLLEKDADMLHELMENDSKKKIKEIDDYQQFWKGWSAFKAKVINLSSVTAKYQENLLSEIENKMMDLVNYKAFTNK